MVSLWLKERCMRVEKITERAASYKLNQYIEDGNDVLAVYDGMQEARACKKW